MTKKAIVCFVLILILLTIVSSASIAKGDTRYNMVGSQLSKYGAKSSIVTKNVYISNWTSCAAFTAYVLDDNVWAQVGFYQGLNPHGQYYNDTRYYYEFRCYENYVFKDLGHAPTNQSHEYGVYLSTYSPLPYGDMIFYRDNNILMDYYGYPKESSYFVAAEAESHDSNNGMDYHFYNVQYATEGLYWYPFSNTKFGCYLNGYPCYNCPYEFINKEDTSWTVIHK